MPLIYITGPTGSGKSTVCQSLKNQGYLAYDTDDDGMRILQNIDNKELKVLDPKVICGLYKDAKNKTLYICGTSPNDIEFANLFDKIYVLNINEYEQKRRIKNRLGNNYGKQPHQLANALKYRNIQMTKFSDYGAININASLTIDKIINIILEIQSK